MVARAARASWVNEQDTQGGELNKKTTIPLTIKAFTSASFHFNRLKRLEVSQQWLTKSGINNKNIYRGEGGQAANLTNLTGDELRIPFRHMMLHDPGPGKGDFVITRDELLHDLADAIW